MIIVDRSGSRRCHRAPGGGALSAFHRDVVDSGGGSLGIHVGDSAVVMKEEGREWTPSNFANLAGSEHLSNRS